MNTNIGIEQLLSSYDADTEFYEEKRRLEEEELKNDRIALKEARKKHREELNALSEEEKLERTKKQRREAQRRYYLKNKKYYQDKSVEWIKKVQKNYKEIREYIISLPENEKTPAIRHIEDIIYGYEGDNNENTR